MRALILAPFHEPSLQRLRQRGVHVAYESWLDTNRLQDPDELAARLAAEKIDILVVEADFVFDEVFESAPGLRLVGVCRNALNQVDLESAAAHGVAVVHARGRNTNAVAEHTLGLMLALARRIPRAHHMVSGGGWRDPAAGYRSMRGREVRGSTVGIIGFGQIGRQAARLCLAFGAGVLACDPFVPEPEILAAAATPATRDEIASRSDFVTVHVADIEGAGAVIDAPFLARMQPTAFVINTSTGSAVDTAALVDALEMGRIAGAALDVFEGQPLPLTSPLLAAPNLLLTPHIGGATDETVERQSAIMADEIERFIAGEPLRYAVTAQQLTHAR